MPVKEKRTADTHKLVRISPEAKGQLQEMSRWAQRKPYYHLNLIIGEAYSKWRNDHAE